jgi:hypothetical protein
MNAIVAVVPLPLWAFSLPGAAWLPVLRLRRITLRQSPIKKM